LNFDDRYERQVKFSPFGEKGQRRLRKSRVVIVGCGGLGANILNLLTRAGAGYIRVIDGDKVEPGNLHRQVLYTERDVIDGMNKAQVAVQRVSEFNSDVSLEPHVARLNADNAIELLSDVDLILDGTDNFESRYIINDFAVKTKTPWIYGGAVGANAACMTFAPGGPCLRCLWPHPPKADQLPSGATHGVLSATPALAASLQVAAAMRILAGHDPIPRLLEIDVWNQQRASVTIKKNPDCVACVQGMYEFLDAPNPGTEV
jgi:molybdopterin-synthase adenylyltransferase